MTIPHSPHSNKPLALQFVDGDDIVSYAAARLQVHLRAACATVEGVQQGDEWIFDLRPLDLAPRLYRTTLQYREIGSDPEWLDAAELEILIERGC